MADLPVYNDLDSKRKNFSNGQKDSFIIKTKQELDKLFLDVDYEDNSSHVTSFIYRGLTEAKYKLLCSAQRLWISNEMNQWANCTYLEFISKLINKAKKDPLLKKVFDLHNYGGMEREFPIMSLLQHYGAPTPLMDWTYNNNVAYYFATELVTNKPKPKSEIDNYFSIYRIDKRNYYNELLNLRDINGENNYPSLKEFHDFGNDDNNRRNSVLYISDFEMRGESTGRVMRGYTKLMIRTQKPITSIFNQNIIPQEGLFIFNPFSEKTLEEVFNVNLDGDGWNLRLTPFECYNIHKDLAEYLRRKIDVRNKINRSFIYPGLVEEFKKVKEQTLNDLIPLPIPALV